MRQATHENRLPSGGALHVAGTPGKRPLLFLHGVGGGAWSWKAQMSGLADRAYSFVWEARGHGGAGRVADAGLGDYFVDAGEALDRVLGEAGRPIVVGHSMGGLLAMALAAERPADVAGLALIEPVYAPDGGTHGGAVGFLMRPLVRTIASSAERDGAISRTIARTLFAQAFENRDAMERAWIDQRTQVPIEYRRMMLEAIDGIRDFPNRAFAEELAVPVLLIEGSVARKRPQFPQLVSTLRERLGPDFHYATLAGGHYLQLDRPDLVNDLLSVFLEGIR